MTLANQTILLSSELNEQFTLNDVLEMVLAAKDIHYGIIKLHSRSRRGVIGVFCGTYIFGAFDKTTNRYGVEALSHLLGADYGIVAFLQNDEAPPDELRQSLGIPIDELLLLCKDGKRSLADALGDLTIESYGLPEVQYIAPHADNSALRDFVDRTMPSGSTDSIPALKSSLWLKIEKASNGDSQANVAAALKKSMTGVKAITDADLARAKSVAVTPVRKHRPQWLMYSYGIVGALIFIALMTQILKGMEFQRQYKLGLNALKSNAPNSAVLAFTASSNLNPKAENVHYFSAIACERSGDYARAIVEFDEALKLNPKDVRALTARASTWIKLENYDSAIKDADKAIKLDPSLLSSYAIKALCSLKMKQYDDAIAAASYFLEHGETAKDPAQASLVFATRGAAYGALGRHKDAIGDFTSALTLEPRSITSCVGRATSYMALGLWASAIKDCNEVLDYNAGDTGVLLMRGKCLATLHRHALAFVDFDKAVKLKPTLDGYRLRADSLFQLHNIPAAQADYGYVLSVDPNDKHASARFRLCHDLVEQLHR